MIRVTNKKDEQTQIQYVDRVVEKMVPQETITKYIDRIVEISVPSEPRIIETIMPSEAKAVDLTGINAHISKHEQYLIALSERIDRMTPIYAELDMQHRALIAIKQQRDIDRKRRLQLIMRLKKQHAIQKRLNFKLKLAIGASLLLILISILK